MFVEQNLAGGAMMPYRIISCCEIDKHSTGLFLAEKLSISRVRMVSWSIVDFPHQDPACSWDNKGSIIASSQAQISLHKILYGIHNKEVGL